MIWTILILDHTTFGLKYIGALLKLLQALLKLEQALACIRLYNIGLHYSYLKSSKLLYHWLTSIDGSI